jgi:hypothetical protein
VISTEDGRTTYTKAGKYIVKYIKRISRWAIAYRGWAAIAMLCKTTNQIESYHSKLQLKGRRRQSLLIHNLVQVYDVDKTCEAQRVSKIYYLTATSDMQVQISKMPEIDTFLSGFPTTSLVYAHLVRQVKLALTFTEKGSTGSKSTPVFGGLNGLEVTCPCEDFKLWQQPCRHIFFEALKARD